MNGLAFIIVLTFAAMTSGGAKDVQTKVIQCSNMRCVNMIEDAARESPTLTRFEVYKRGSEGRSAISGRAFFPPMIAWSPL